MDDLRKGTLLANLEGCARAHLMSLHHGPDVAQGLSVIIYPLFKARCSKIIYSTLLFVTRFSEGIKSHDIFIRNFYSLASINWTL